MELDVPESCYHTHFIEKILNEMELDATKELTCGDVGIRKAKFRF